MWPKIKLIQAFMVVLVTCKNGDDLFKNEGSRVVTISLTLLVCKSMQNFPDAQGQLTPQSEGGSA